MLVLDSLFRERSGPYESSSHSLKPEFPQQVWKNIHHSKVHMELGPELILLHPYNKKEKSIIHNFMLAHFKLTPACTQEHSGGLIQYKTSMKFSKVWLQNFATNPLHVCISVA